MTELFVSGAVGVLIGAGIVFLILKAKASGLAARSEELVRAREEATAEMAVLRETNSSLRADLAAERAAREQEIKGWAEKQEALIQAQEELMKQFDALSRKALDSNSKSFMELAKTQIEKMVQDVDTKEEKRKLELEKLVSPLSKTLEDVSKHVREVEKERERAYTSITEQVKGLSVAQESIRKEAANLVNALRKPSVRGRWGEIQLKRVVEMAGMLDHCDFEEQHTVHSDSGRLRPDMIVHLAGGKTIVVDAKAPLSAYLDAIETDDEDERERFMRKHAEQVKIHIRQLSTKAYQDQFDSTPDMVVLFLPGESFYYAAQEIDPTLIEQGVENNVVIATPTTLITLLKAVAYGWRQEQLTENAQKISRLGQELYERLSVLSEHINKVGRGLNSAVTSYNKAAASMESRVLVSARKFKELGSSTSSELPEMKQIEGTPRQLELGSSDEA
ncbi:MAG: DNA recombination protein RmuC [Bacteroidetes bacterium]|nr:DNA recombination protein RmuC [Bacteroidota bacterium]MDA1333510.1 DNA recombination protein RmuC [Bacteroidota bacterium]